LEYMYSKYMNIKSHLTLWTCVAFIDNNYTYRNARKQQWGKTLLAMITADKPLDNTLIEALLI